MVSTGTLGRGKCGRNATRKTVRGASKVNRGGHGFHSDRGRKNENDDEDWYMSNRSESGSRKIKGRMLKQNQKDELHARPRGLEGC